jgi:hypothetical protein
MATHAREREPPPITEASRTTVPDAASASKQSRKEKATPSKTAWVRAARPAPCDRPAKAPRIAPSLWGVRSPER